MADFIEETIASYHFHLKLAKRLRAQGADRRSGADGSSQRLAMKPLSPPTSATERYGR